MKRVLVMLAVFVCLLLVAAAIVEFTASPSQKKLRYFRTRSVFQYHRDHVVFDPVIGYRLTPNLNVQFSNEEFSTTVHTNAVGFRDDNQSLTEPDVLFLGDSYVFGWGVEEADGVEKQYERLTGKKVLNMGVPGYSNVQELLMLHKWAQTSPPVGKKIFLFFSANDFIDNQNTSFNTFPYFMEQGGSFELSQPSNEGFMQWQEAVDKWTIHAPVAKRSMLAFFLLNVVKNMQVKDIYKDYREDDKALNGNKAFVLVAEQLAAFAKQYQCEVTIVYVPAHDNAHNKQLPLVRGVCAKLGLHFADLTPHLTAGDYFPLDMHWTASGHEKVARNLSPALSEGEGGGL